jgi:hypothetical protein
MYIGYMQIHMYHFIEGHVYLWTLLSAGGSGTHLLD